MATKYFLNEYTWKISGDANLKNTRMILIVWQGPHHLLIFCKGCVLLLTSASFKDVTRKAFNNKYLNVNFNDKDSSTPELASIPMLVVKINGPYMIPVISRNGQDRLCFHC